MAKSNINEPLFCSWFLNQTYLKESGSGKQVKSHQVSSTKTSLLCKVTQKGNRNGLNVLFVMFT